MVKYKKMLNCTKCITVENYSEWKKKRNIVTMETIHFPNHILYNI